MNECRAGLGQVSAVGVDINSLKFEKVQAKATRGGRFYY